METEDIHARTKQSKFSQGHGEQDLKETKVLDMKRLIT
jgi:hypothetical protein